MLARRRRRQLGDRWGRLDHERLGTWWRVWGMLKDEIAPMSTGALFWQENAWAACLQVLVERPRRRKLQRLPSATLDVLSRCNASKHTDAERSFPLLNLLEMLCPPRSQSLLYRWRPLQNPLDNVQ